MARHCVEGVIPNEVGPCRMKTLADIITVEHKSSDNVVDGGHQNPDGDD
jgi:hypothetical protein